MATNPLLRYGPPRQINCTLGVSGGFPNYTSGAAYTGTVSIAGAQGATTVGLVPPGTDASGGAYVPLVNPEFAAGAANWQITAERVASTFSFQAGAGRTAAGFLRWQPASGAPNDYFGDTIGNTTIVQSTGQEVNVSGWVRCTAIGPQPNSEILDILIGVQIYNDAAATSPFETFWQAFTTGGSGGASRRISGIIDWFPLFARVTVPAGKFYRLAFQLRAGTSGTVEIDDCQWDARGVPLVAPTALGLPAGFTIDTLASPDRVRVQWPGIPSGGKFAIASGVTSGLIIRGDATGTWPGTDTVSTGLTGTLRIITNATDRIYAVSADGKSAAVSSTKGDTWSGVTISGYSLASGETISGVFKFGSNYIMGTTDSATGNLLLTSADGVTFTSISGTGGALGVSNSNYRGATLGTVGIIGANSGVRRSTNGGSTWANVSLAGAFNYTVAATTQNFIAISGNNARIYTSATADTGTWTQRTTPGGLTAFFGGLIAGYGADDGKVCAVDNSGRIFYSLNHGVTWTAGANLALSTGNGGDQTYSLAYGGGAFFFVGAGGVVLSTTDLTASSWTTVFDEPGFSGNAESIVYLAAPTDTATSALTNLDFETGDSSYLKGAGWAITNAAPADAGSWSAKYSGLGQSSLTHLTMAPVTPGTSITASCRVSKGNNRKDFGGGAVLLEWLDANTRPIGFNVGNVVNTGSSAFQTSSVTATAPAGAAFVRLGASGTRDVKGRASDIIAVDTFAWNHTFALGGSGGGGGTATPTTGPVSLTFRVTDSVGCSAVATRTINQA